MNLVKHIEFFDPTTIRDSVHVIGVGAIGSIVVEQLVRLGFENIHIYDFDTVTDYNVTNQLYRAIDIGEKKTTALIDMCRAINPEIKITEHATGWSENNIISGYVFLCVDSIELRSKIAQRYALSTNIKAMFDFRMRLTDAQHYAANWDNDKSKSNFIKTMDFTDAEAVDATPVSACGTTLSVSPTIRMIVSCGMTNFLNFLKEPTALKSMVIADPFKFEILAI